MKEILTRAGIDPPVPVVEITMEMVEAEIARLVAELVAEGKPLPPQGGGRGPDTDGKGSPAE